MKLFTYLQTIQRPQRVRLMVAFAVFMLALTVFSVVAFPAGLRAQSPNLFSVKQLRVTNSSDLRGDVTIGGSTSAGDISADGISATTLSLGGTPYATSTPSAKCGTQSVTGSATAVHGFPTPGAVSLTIGQALTADGWAVSYSSNVSNSVTINVYKLAGPTPNTTPAVVSWCVRSAP